MRSVPAQDVAIAAEKSCDKYFATVGIHRDHGLEAATCSKSHGVTIGHSNLLR